MTETKPKRLWNGRRKALAKADEQRITDVRMNGHSILETAEITDTPPTQVRNVMHRYWMDSGYDHDPETYGRNPILPWTVEKVREEIRIGDTVRMVHSQNDGEKNGVRIVRAKVTDKSRYVFVTEQETPEGSYRESVQYTDLVLGAVEIVK